MFEMTVETHFDAAHHISGYLGKCLRPHGHRFLLKVTISGSKLNDLNMLIDFKNIKELLNELTESHLDHYYLNDTLPDNEHVTAEYLAEWIYKKLKPELFKTNQYVKLESVTVFESPECGVTYYA